MILGKWNPSVYLTYLGVSLSVLGMYLSLFGPIEAGFICLIWAGVADLFDGTVARRVKRTPEEKAFGIQLDTVADVVSFLLLPIVLAFGQGFGNPFYLVIYIFYVVAGLARLADFSVAAGDTPVQHYRGLPVTYAALIFPFARLLNYVLPGVYEIFYLGIILVTGLLFILDIPIPKPRLKAMIGLGLLAIALTVVYLIILR